MYLSLFISFSINDSIVTIDKMLVFYFKNISYAIVENNSIRIAFL